MPLDDLKPFLGDIDALLSVAGEGKDSYAQPALKNLGSVCLMLVREVISPASFRNADPEVTDVQVAGRRHVRAGQAG